MGPPSYMHTWHDGPCSVGAANVRAMSWLLNTTANSKLHQTRYPHSLNSARDIYSTRCTVLCNMLSTWHVFSSTSCAEHSMRSTVLASAAVRGKWQRLACAPPQQTWVGGDDGVARLHEGAHGEEDELLWRSHEHVLWGDCVIQLRDLLQQHLQQPRARPSTQDTTTHRTDRTTRWLVCS